ncbi:MAG: 2,3-bisphosphoglycerate-independent phosphoglycerate mutase [Gammaproteobacteria bacterium]|nr:2,3-bisphosphoglycerate-independent phosphoglycerate mutase [Gammaproteobacteria bacterium]
MAEPRSVPRSPTLLIILDGFGVNPSRINNAVAEANTPRLDEYFSKNTHITLDASGKAVGLPVGQMGNSEVGHLTLGCGSIMRQDLVRIDDAIENGEFFDNAALVAALDDAAAKERPMHLVGLVSDGGVHSHINHLVALIEMCARKKVKPLVHMITDGRDTAPMAAMGYLKKLEDVLEDAGGAIATVCGRYYAMDRDNRWDRTEVAWRAMVHHEGEFHEAARYAIESAYAADQTDEFIRPCILPEAEKLQKGDNVIFFNFRNDRPRQLSAALSQPDFEGFETGTYDPITVTCLTEYDPQFLLPIAFAPERPHSTLASVVSRAGYKQFHCSETEKYAHVTFFFNGGREEKWAGEDRVMIPSPKVSTYDKKPEMSAREVADATIDALKSHDYGFLVVNFANGDMVGHTAVREAVIAAVEAMDAEVGRLLDVAVEEGFSVFLTADHGNCDEMVDPVTGEPHTQHTVYPVPCLIIDQEYWRLATGMGLSSVAPTILQLMGLQQPPDMKGESILLEAYNKMS